MPHCKQRSGCLLSTAPQIVGHCATKECLAAISLPSTNLVLVDDEPRLGCHLAWSCPESKCVNEVKRSAARHMQQNPLDGFESIQNVQASYYL